MRKIALLSVFALVFLLGSKIILADEDVPSDLALDLAQAEKNPAPQRRQIIGDEAPKAEVTTSVGRVTIQPEMQLALEVEKQPASQTEHPEQTTSAQVQETTVSPETSTDQGSTNSGVNVEQPELNNGSGGADNLVPGTTIKEPDDNAAPPATPSASPTTSIEELPTPTPEMPPVVTSPETNTPPDSNSQPENPQPDSTVQGVSTQRLDLWGRMVNFFRGLIR